MAIVGLLVSAFAGGGGASRGSAPATVAVPAAARDSCLTFDKGIGRLAAKDNKGFIDDMTNAASSAQAAAAAGPQWEPLVVGFASFATDLAANNPQKVFNDLDGINQLCAAVRGPRTLDLKGQGP